MCLLLRFRSVRLRDVARLEEQVSKRKRRRRRRKTPDLVYKSGALPTGPGTINGWNRVLVCLDFPSTTSLSTFVQHFEGSSTGAYENQKAGGRKIQFHLLLLLPKRNEVLSSQPLFHLVLAVPHLSCMAEKFPPSLKTPILSKGAHSPEFCAVEEIKPRFHLI